MAATHTPGPWILATSNSWRRIVTEFDTREVCVPTKQQDGHPDLHFPNPVDAQVMVAGPELLEALQRYVALDIKADGYDGKTMRQDSGLHRAAVAAIEKATGGAS